MTADLWVAGVWLALAARSLVATLLGIVQIRRSRRGATTGRRGALASARSENAGGAPARGEGAGGAPPLLSIVVPAHDEAQALPRMLAALAACTHPSLEIIVVDDGSTDGTAAVIESWRHRFGAAPHCRRFASRRHERNRGKAAALNTGIAQCRGAFIATVDADTELHPDALARCVRHLAAGGAPAVACRIEVARPRRLIERLQAVEYAAGLHVERCGQALVGAVSVLPGAATVYRAELLRRHPFSDRTRTEDADHTLTLATLGHRADCLDAAVAHTEVPAGYAALRDQRVRWLAGHLECVARHARAPRSAGVDRGRTDARFLALTYPNFVLVNLGGLLMLGCGLYVGLHLGFGLGLDPARAGTVRLLGLPPLAWVAASVGLIYAQRLAAIVAIAGPGRRPPGIASVLLEPPFSALLYLHALACVMPAWRRRKR